MSTLRWFRLVVLLVFSGMFIACEDDGNKDRVDTNTTISVTGDTHGGTSKKTTTSSEEKGTGVLPEVGTYDFSVPGRRFVVSGNETNGFKVTFYPEDYSGYTMKVSNGKFSFQHGIVEGNDKSNTSALYPTDGFRLSGKFIDPKTATGTYLDVYDGRIEKSYSFTAIR